MCAHVSLCPCVCVHVNEDTIADEIQMSEQHVMSKMALSFHGIMLRRCD